MATKQLFEATLGIKPPWSVQGVDFEADKHLLTIAAAFIAGSWFAHPDAPGAHPMHDTRTKRLRHLNFFQHECFLEVRLPRVRLPDTPHATQGRGDVNGCGVPRFTGPEPGRFAI